MDSKTTIKDRFRNIWENSPTARTILQVSLGDLASKIFSVATVLLLIRGLSIPDYAAYTTFSGISVLFSGVVGTGINMAMVRFSSDLLSRGREKPIDLYFLAILIQILLYILVGGICFLFPDKITNLLFGVSDYTLPLQLGLLAGLGMLILQFTRSLYQAEERFGVYIGVLWLVQVLTFIGLAALWMLSTLSFVTAAVSFVTIQLGLGLWILIIRFRIFRLTTNLSSVLQKSELQQFLIGSGWLIGYFVILNIFNRMDVLMLLRFKGERELSIYGVAFQYYSLALLILGSIHAVLLPKFSRADMQNSKKQKDFLKQWIKWSAWIIIPIIIFDLLGKPVYILINGVIYEKSFEIFVIFSFGVWISFMLSPLVNILLSRGEFHFLFKLSILAFIVNFASNLLLVPTFGGAGAALTIVLTQNIFIQLPVLVKGLKNI